MTTHVVIYSRCSTDEKRQDTEVQLVELRRYAKAYGWTYDEVSEYGSAFKGIIGGVTAGATLKRI